MHNGIRLGSVLVLLILLVTSHAGGVTDMKPIIFATYAEQEEELGNILILVKSIRAFAGAYRDATVWVYTPPDLPAEVPEAINELTSLNVQMKISQTPPDAAWFFFAGKVFAAGRAETDAAGVTSLLAWLDTDTIMLQEPAEFILPSAKTFGYRPVMHKNIGLLYSDPVDDFWARVYERMEIREGTLFPMVTPADGDTIRPYFNAGCLVVRPERGTLARWGEYFTKLYQDDVLTRMCQQEVKYRIFIHQTALTGAILNHLERAELNEFSDRINYPIFFEQMFGAQRTFDDITHVVTFRHESYFRNPAPDWHERLKGPADRIEWVRTHLATP